MGAVTLALVGFFAFVILRVSQPAMGVLFSDLSGTDTGAVVRDLDTRGIRYETRDDGATVLVPRSEIGRIRMELAGKGLPTGGGIGYEIFDKGDAFSSTSFVQNVNRARALEGELSRSIRSIGRIAAARVHLALPEKRLFERDREPPRASIVLKLRGDLGTEQVGAIRHLVASAVEGLLPENISVVDERGRLLANGAGSGESAGTGGGQSADDKRVALERRLRSQVEEIVAGIVGSGRARVQVAAELDTSRIESRHESFDPESRVVRSTQTRGETSATASGDNAVTVGNELPGARDGAAAAPPPPRDSANKTEETVNYEISRTTRTEVLGAGRLKRVSVAVLVDGIHGRAPNGEATYQPRSREDLERMAALVRTAVGFDRARGDQVEVVNLPLADAPVLGDVEAPPGLLASLFRPTKEDVMRWTELTIIAVLTFIVVMVVVRPLVRRILSPDLLAAGNALALGRGDAVPALAGAEVPSLPEPGSIGSVAPDQMSRLTEVAKTNPRQAAAVLRGWMAEE